MNTMLLRKSPYNLGSSRKSAALSSHKFLPLPFFSTASIRNSSPESPFIVEYLISSVGLLLKDAIRVSKFIAHIKSPSKPDRVLTFFKQSGFGDSHIKKIINERPRILCADVESTLTPKLKTLMELGFSQSEVAKLVSADSCSLYVKNIRPKIEFFKALLRSNENLLKAVNRNRILGSSIEKKIKPNISFLKEFLSDNQIMSLITNCHGFITKNLDFLKTLVRRVEELGFVPGTRMYYYALSAFSKVSESRFHEKQELLKSLGCSEVEIIFVFRKVPRLAVISRKKLQDKAEFLVKEAGLQLSYVIAHPIFLCHSLEKRLIPRINVLQLLRSNGILQGDVKLVKAMSISNKKFVECFILPSEKKITKLHETFLAACAGKLIN